MNAEILARLAAGETIENHKESGNSMVPLIKHREPVTLAPVNTDLLDVGDIVLAKVSGHLVTHLVNAVDGDRVQIANNHGYVNGWTHKSKVYAIVTHVNGVARSGAGDKVKCSHSTTKLVDNNGKVDVICEDCGTVIGSQG